MLELYNHSYSQAQLEKFHNRYNNHWQNHIKLAKELVRQYGPLPPAKILDLGCSIGTYALEFALDGYDTAGLDFDPKALEQAQNLANELGCKPQWICDDASSFTLKEKVDIILCFDLLEHLDDEQITKTFSRIRSNLKNDGIFIFHTFPTQYDHIFYNGKFTSLPLIPFRKLSKNNFENLVSKYAQFVDIFYVLRHGKTHKKLISKTVHPNPLSIKRITNFLNGAGLDILLLENGIDNLNPLKRNQGKLTKKYLSNQPLVSRSIWGVVRKKA